MMRDRRTLIGAVATAVSLLAGKLGWAGPAASDRPQGRPDGAEWLPFAAGERDAVLLSVSVGDASLSGMVDTGAPTTVIDGRLAAKLGIRNTGHSTVRGNVGAARISRGDAVRLRLGSQIVNLGSVMLADLSLTSAPDGRPIQIILGRDVFEGGVLDIDFPQQRLAVRPRDTFVPPAGARRLPLRRGSRGEQCIDVSLESGPDVAATLDLGSSNPLMISGAYARERNLLKDRPVSSAATAGVDGVNVSATTSLSSIQLGATPIGDVPCEVFDNWYSTDVPANIGFPVLSRFRIALDFVGENAWLTPNRRLVRAPFVRDLSGLGLAVRPDRLRVVHVARAGPAALSGWAVGDEVIAVDGHPIDPSYPTSRLARWREGPAGHVVVLTLSNGQVRRLTLARYY